MQIHVAKRRAVPQQNTCGTVIFKQYRKQEFRFRNIQFLKVLLTNNWNIVDVDVEQYFKA